MARGVQNKPTFTLWVFQLMLLGVMRGGIVEFKHPGQ